MKLTMTLLEQDYHPFLDETCALFTIDRLVYGDTHRALADTLATCHLPNKLKQATHIGCIENIYS
jgi:hypothetical protein